MICNFVFNIALLSLNVHVKAKAIAFETKKNTYRQTYDSDDLQNIPVVHLCSF